MKIKTNAKCAGCSAAIKKSLSSLAPAEEWEIDLTSPDRILTYTGASEPPVEAVVAAVRGAGFQAEAL